jgi:protein SCO1/2
MEAMTMPFTLKQEWAYKALAPGDRVQATLVVSGDRSWLEQIVITKKSEVPPDISNAQPLWDLGAKLGDDLPNFSLVNQDAHPIQLRQYRGKALILTFIYTRCPLPDFCPKMTGNFAEIHRTLQQQPVVYEKTHLLSISFDYAYDTPEVLRAYGAAFAGSDSPEIFAHWEFATGSAQEVKAVTKFFGLLYVPETDQIAHSLRTAVITPDGKVFKVYTDNLWTPADILRDVEQVLRRKG